MSPKLDLANISALVVLSLLQAVLRVVAASLPLFNAVNLATAVNCMGKMRAPPDVLASASQHPALASLKAAVSAPNASTCFCEGPAEARQGMRPEHSGVAAWY